MSNAKIDRFIGEFEFLSNFYPSPIMVEGKLYKTVEHAYQALKTLNPDSRELIRRAKTPGEAKKLGRSVELRAGWDEGRRKVMKELIVKKFENPFLKEKLLNTGSAELIEGNNWNDTYFGVCRGKGLNVLGEILQEVRDEYREELETESGLFGE